MLENFLRRFKETDRELAEEAVRMSRDANQRITNWRAVVFWALVIVAGILLYFLADKK